MVKQETDMNDSEIISLLSEYNLKKDEISRLLKGIERRDFESVLEYVEAYRADNAADAERRQAMEAAKEHEKEVKQEEARMRVYKEDLLKKIQANRDDFAQRMEKEAAEEAAPVVKTQQISDPVKVKVNLNHQKLVLLGFPLEATVKDLVEKIRDQAGASGFEIRKCGSADKIPESDRKIVEVFGAKSVMIEAIFR
ncbi:hypothetical protein PAPHI01_0310 [Pancytospora philotis]|nr:hypothetical protein PAPHI01_0310 [Pancytospora philotis]